MDLSDYLRSRWNHTAPHVGPGEYSTHSHQRDPPPPGLADDPLLDAGADLRRYSLSAGSLPPADWPPSSQYTSSAESSVGGPRYLPPIVPPFDSSASPGSIRDSEDAELPMSGKSSNSDNSPFSPSGVTPSHVLPPPPALADDAEAVAGPSTHPNTGGWTQPKLTEIEIRPHGTVGDRTFTDAATGKRKYGCGECEKYFSTSGHLSRHKRIHRGEKNFRCTIAGCDSKFSRQDNLNQHVKTHYSARARAKSGSSKKSSKESASGSSRRQSGQSGRSTAEDTAEAEEEEDEDEAMPAEYPARDPLPPSRFGSALETSSQGSASVPNQTPGQPPEDSEYSAGPYGRQPVFNRFTPMVLPGIPYGGHGGIGGLGGQQPWQPNRGSPLLQVHPSLPPLGTAAPGVGPGGDGRLQPAAALPRHLSPLPSPSLEHPQRLGGASSEPQSPADATVSMLRLKQSETPTTRSATPQSSSELDYGRRSSAHEYQSYFQGLEASGRHASSPYGRPPSQSSQHEHQQYRHHQHTTSVDLPPLRRSVYGEYPDPRYQYQQLQHHVAPPPLGLGESHGSHYPSHHPHLQAQQHHQPQQHYHPPPPPAHYHSHNGNTNSSLNQHHSSSSPYNYTS